jgi:hypothetical protein
MIMDMGRKAAYLKGLIDGLGVDKGTKEGKVISLMADILEEAALLIEDLQAQIDEIVEVVDIIDRDLDELEEDFYEMDNNGKYYDEYYDEDGFFDGESYEITCPSCGDAVFITDDMLNDGFVNCPNCDEYLELDIYFSRDEEYDGEDDDDDDE